MRIADNAFAAACYEQNSIQELLNALMDEPDAADLETWDITAQAWREEIRIALEAKLADQCVDVNK
uniref:Uncharacterized protein n=1 Tax=viral metagenome TaxID=1070528 RepID=A0A6M3XLQ7_9ZZZZ